MTVDLTFKHLTVITTRGETFGPQPYLAIKTKDGRYFHDNFDYMDHSSQNFSYTFDDYTIPLADIAKLGIASNDKFGNQFVHVISL